MKTALLIVLATLLLTSAAVAGQVTLAWDANDPVPTGYALFARWSENGNPAVYDYTTPIWPTEMVHHTETTCTVTVPDNCEVAFVVRAYKLVTALDGTTDILWSGDSNEVVYTDAVTPANPSGLIAQAVQQVGELLNTLSQLMVAINGSATLVPQPGS